MRFINSCSKIDENYTKEEEEIIKDAFKIRCRNQNIDKHIEKQNIRRKFKPNIRFY